MLVAGPKPLAGQTYLGWTELEFLMKPGSQIYPLANVRSRAYQRLGLTRGTSFVVEPGTGRTINIHEVTVDPKLAASPVKPLFDIGGIQRIQSYQQAASVARVGREALSSRSAQTARSLISGSAGSARGLVTRPRRVTIEEFRVAPSRRDPGWTPSQEMARIGRSTGIDPRAFTDRDIRPDTRIRPVRIDPRIISRDDFRPWPWGGITTGMPGYTLPTQKRLKLDFSEPRGLRLNLSLKGYDWTVRNPVPTFESVFGSSFAVKPLRMPKFRLPKFRF